MLRLKKAVATTWICWFMSNSVSSMLRLKKGCGYHLDLLVLAVIIIISSIFGLPWFVANTVPSINHMQSLAKVHLVPELFIPATF
jgi:hypothetical protein